ncbi:MAG: response regulator [Polyangiaceae bacterium]
MRILIVEDSDSIRVMLETLVAGCGHAVEAVSRGAQGVEAALARPPAAILLDLHLPGGKDGLDVVRELRGRDETRLVPIIVISADDASKDRAIEAGASAYYTKPFSPTALLKHLESLFTKASERS